jgi:hypothetical protein
MTTGITWWQQIAKIDDYYPSDLVVRVDSVLGDDDAESAGETWELPFATIQAGLNKARYLLGTTTIADAKNHRAKVLVAPGHYNEQILFSGYGIDLIGLGSSVPGKDYGVVINYDGAVVAAPAVVAFSGSAISIQNVFIVQQAAYPALYIAGGDNNLIRNVVIEGDNSLCTIGILAESMKGSWIRDCVITDFVTAGIHVAGASEAYFLHGGIEGNFLFSQASSPTGILVDLTNLVARGSVIRNNDIVLELGASSKGIDVNHTGSILVRDNFVSVPTSGTPIEHAGGAGYMIGNHTAAGTTIVDPNTAAS